MAKSCFEMCRHNLKPIISMCAAAFMLFAVVLCSCGSSDENKTITLQTVFSKKFSAEYDGTKFSGKVDSAEDTTVFTLDSPDTLKGTKIAVNNADKSMKANIYGMEITLDSSKYPPAAFASAVVSAICETSKKGDAFAVNGKIEGESNGLKYTISTDENGDISEINFKSVPLKIILSS